ncbi:MAG: bifunctional glutamine-synthetase adenylyltransferase/deadenyltransferase, partial [Salinibacterium sp.]|nr:bifunctional glutamine-synthetase adenylyltransferase/deadenyltransferase [Salinibacterium sp.]
MSRQPTTLTELARLGFSELEVTNERLNALGAPAIVSHFAAAADPDQALRLLGVLREQAPTQLAQLIADEDAAARLIRVLGASAGLGDFLARNPEQLAALGTPLVELPSSYAADLLGAAAAQPGEAGWQALRVRYRRHLLQLASWDLDHPDPLAAVSLVAAALADLASAALDAALAIARRVIKFPAAEVAATGLAIIGMGKAGARELNYVSDVDVIFVAESAGPELSDDRAVTIATQLAMQTMRAIHDFGREPGLWEVDANLRPEGKDGALVRTLDSHLAYYDRWAKSWEFQALLKARPLAGDLELGQRYVDALAPKVWSSASRENFVESVQRMRERVTENIPPEEL